MLAEKGVSDNRVEIFADGACRGNPGPGGWGALLRYNGKEKKIWGHERHTTNNRMELMAVIKAFEALTRACRVSVTTDSRYVHDGMTKWLLGWQKNGWRNSQKEPVKNADLWQRLLGQAERHQVTWHWIKGHSGHTENELADQLANHAIDQMMKEEK